jgi:hypothetical protein
VKITVREIARVVGEAIAEAKKAKETDPSLVPAGLPHEYSSDPSLDFSEPLGDRNRLRRQGSNPGWGPTTEQKVRTIVRAMIREALGAEETGMSSSVRQKLQSLSAKHPRLGDWFANVSNHPGDVVSKMGYAQDQLSSMGVKGSDYIDAILVAAEMLRGDS